MSQVGIIFALILTSVCLSSCDYSGESFKLDRNNDDKFENPTATSCDWKPTNRKFCDDTNSRCDQNCCRCTCDYTTSTFDRKTMKCRKNDEFRLGCKTKFINSYQRSRVKLLDLTTKGETKIYWGNEIYGDEVKSLDIDSISWYHDGHEIDTKFLTTKGKPKESGGNWQMTIKWDKVSSTYNGEIFRVNTSYRIERKLRGNRFQIDKNDCFIFKSSGSITVTFPSLPTEKTSSPTVKSSPTSILPTTSIVSFTSPKTAATTRPTRKPTRKSTRKSTRKATRKPTRKPTEPEPSVISKDFSTGADSPTTKINPDTRETQVPKSPIKVSTSPTVVELSTHSPGVEARKGDDGGNNSLVIPLVVVACLILLVGVGLLVFWSRKRSSRASKDKETVIANRNADNPMMMSPSENIYAEADNPVNYSGKNGKHNDVYDYATGDFEKNYTSLDKSKVESKPAYQSLINAHSNTYEQIPGKNEPSNSNGETSISEPFYHVVDGTEGTQDPGPIYHSVDETAKPDNYNTHNRAMPGRSGNEEPERVYSTLEDESETVVPEHVGREIPGRTGDDDPERVYSILEDDNPEYLTVLHDEAEYEQPVNPPVPGV